MKHDLLTSVFTRLQPRLLASARRLLADDADARDALQDAFCRLWQHRDDIGGERQAEGISVVSVRNACIDVMRRRRLRDADPIDGIEAEVTSDDPPGILDEVTAVIEQALTPRQRDILYMRDREGYEIAEIADRYGLSEANVRLILSRARKTVRECYRQNRLKR